MNDDTKRYQYLRPALILSPSGKAITRLAHDQVCVVRLYEAPGVTRYWHAIVDLVSGEADEAFEPNLSMLEMAFKDAGLPISPYQRIWLALEWW